MSESKTPPDEGKGAPKATFSDRLTTSSGWITGTAFVLSVATIIFMIWFRASLTQQSRVGAPTAEAAAELDSSVNRSIAALRGWVAYGDTSFLQARRMDWESIDRAHATLVRLASTVDQPTRRRRIESLGRTLRDLRRVQWGIEDVARTPGNEPARWKYESSAKPVLASARAALRQIPSMRQGALDGRGQAQAIIGDDARLLADTLASADESFLVYIEQGGSVDLTAFQTQLDSAKNMSERLSAHAEMTAKQRSFVEFAKGELRAYELFSEDVVRLRERADWNVARNLFATTAGPLAENVTTLSRALAKTEMATLRRSVDLFAVLSIVVIASAFLMAIVSLLSIFVAIRLHYRMRTAMDQVKTLGQYSLDRKLGQGGMGQVFLARHAMLRRPTAIKLLHASTRHSKDALDRFRREVQTTSRLTHPNTIAIFDYGRTPAGVFYYAMEYLDGANLEEIVAATGPMSPARTIRILRQAAGSLAEAHSQGLLHRDIKPANIMLCQQGGIDDRVKVLDFGLARDLATDAEEAEEGIQGTPHYIAPEAILEADGNIPQSDLYALGAVAYFLLTGHRIVDGETLFELLSHHIATVPRLPSELVEHPIPRDLELLIMSCLEKDPLQRPRSATKLGELLLALNDSHGWTDKDARSWWTLHQEIVAEYVASKAADSAQHHSRLEIAMGDTRLSSD